MTSMVAWHLHVPFDGTLELHVLMSSEISKPLSVQDRTAATAREGAQLCAHLRSLLDAGGSIQALVSGLAHPRILAT